MLALLINVAAARLHSRITSIHTVEVKGLHEDDQKRVKNILIPLQGLPANDVRGRAIETEVLRESAIESATFTHNMWGGAKLVVNYRKPVASMSGNPNLGVDEDGVIFESPSIDPKLPKIQLPSNGPATLLTVAANWDVQRLADLAQKVRSIPEASGVSIEVDESGEVCLNMDSGRVVLGSCDDLDEKLSVLQKRLLANPAELSQVERLILTRPDAPAVVPLPKNTSHRAPKNKQP